MAKGFADREGVVLVATDSFDVSADAEDPALALDQLVPAWRRRDMSLSVRVVSDWPTPGLVHMAAELGAQVIPSGGDLVSVLGRARLAVAPVKHGVSARRGYRRHGRGDALAVTEKAVNATFLEDMGGLGVVPDVAGMAPIGWSLLTDEAAWNDFAGSLSAQQSDLADRRDRAFTPPS